MSQFPTISKKVFGLKTIYTVKDFKTNEVFCTTKKQLAFDKFSEWAKQ